MRASPGTPLLRPWQPQHQRASWIPSASVCLRVRWLSARHRNEPLVARQRRPCSRPRSGHGATGPRKASRRQPLNRPICSRIEFAYPTGCRRYLDVNRPFSTSAAGSDRVSAPHGRKRRPQRRPRRRCSRRSQRRKNRRWKSSAAASKRQPDAHAGGSTGRALVPRSKQAPEPDRSLRTAGA
jgi:hypothetical protein